MDCKHSSRFYNIAYTWYRQQNQNINLKATTSSHKSKLNIRCHLSDKLYDSWPKMCAVSKALKPVKVRTWCDPVDILSIKDFHHRTILSFKEHGDLDSAISKIIYEQEKSEALDFQIPNRKLGKKLVLQLGNTWNNGPTTDCNDLQIWEIFRMTTRQGWLMSEKKNERGKVKMKKQRKKKNKKVRKRMN